MKKQIKNFEDHYEIHDNGQIFNVRTNKYLKLCKKENGYYQAKLFVSYDKSIGKRIYAYLYIHRLVAEYFIDNPKNLPCVNHKDGNKANNDISNLEWCSYSQNMKHAVKTGLFVKERKIKDLESIFLDYISKSFTLAELENKYSWFIGSKLTEYLFKYAKETNRLDLFNEAKNNQLHLRSLKNGEKCSKKVKQFSLDGSFIKEWSSTIEAARSLKINQGNISNVCTGRSKTAGGFIWKYS